MGYNYDENMVRRNANFKEYREDYRCLMCAKNVDIINTQKLHMFKASGGVIGWENVLFC